MTFINQHSFTLSAAAVVVILAAVLLRDGVRANDLVALGALILGLGLAYFLLRPGPSTSALAEQLTAPIGAGRPVLLEFQSPY